MDHVDPADVGNRSLLKEEPQRGQSTVRPGGQHKRPVAESAALGDNVGIAEVGRAYRQSQLVCE